MARLSSTADAILASAPPLPLDPEHWRKVVKAIGLSQQQARIVELMLRGLCDKQIAAVMGISESTIDTYMQRIGKRTGTSGVTVHDSHAARGLTAARFSHLAGRRRRARRAWRRSTASRRSSAR